MNNYIREINMVRSSRKGSRKNRKASRKNRKQRGSGGIGLMGCPPGTKFNWDTKSCVPIPKSRKSRKQRGSGGIGLMSCGPGMKFNWATKSCVPK
jgi:hypothetical protein